MSQVLEKDFKDYLEQYEAMITKVARIYSYDVESQKDLVQEIVLQLWRAFPKYVPERSTSTWTYRIALNVSISFLRKDSSRRKREGEYSQEYRQTTAFDENLDDRINQLYRFIDTLKSTDKALILLFLEGCKNKEIAEVMGVTPSLVSTKLHRIKGQLKEYFESLNRFMN
ncbi:RNA polymerase subunit sigma-70 [Echinicola strongylocentroti]|uniref:RNA polymerase subunit sigma-70 n=1 Tax=Echinicola strongylocentroti TaxID=1795355 RepID=A0A2Z4IKD0_9BACT|nr:sigma-70 family RNA polymerase sigma factor [Echinicola strongylocentroti]AWW30823.1 RNA polymerase subunit sigma-70 [Echinicola strongylocentroti]